MEYTQKQLEVCVEILSAIESFDSYEEKLLILLTVLRNYFPMDDEDLLRIASSVTKKAHREYWGKQLEKRR